MLVFSRPNNIPTFGYLAVTDSHGTPVRILKKKGDAGYLGDVAEKLEQGGWYELEGDIGDIPRVYDDPRSKPHFVAFDVMVSPADPAEVALAKKTRDCRRNAASKTLADLKVGQGVELVKTADIRSGVAATAARAASQAQAAEPAGMPA